MSSLDGSDYKTFFKRTLDRREKTSSVLFGVTVVNPCPEEGGVGSKRSPLPVVEVEIVPFSDPNRSSSVPPPPLRETKSRSLERLPSSPRVPRRPVSCGVETVVSVPLDLSLVVSTTGRFSGSDLDGSSSVLSGLSRYL